MRCCVPECVPKKKGFGLHCVPANEPQRTRWLSFAGLDAGAISASTRLFICGAHFAEEAYKGKTRKYLVKEAVPTIRSDSGGISIAGSAVPPAQRPMPLHVTKRPVPASFDNSPSKRRKSVDGRVVYVSLEEVGGRLLPIRSFPGTDGVDQSTPVDAHDVVATTSEVVTASDSDVTVSSEVHDHSTSPDPQEDDQGALCRAVSGILTGAKRKSRETLLHSVTMARRKQSINSRLVTGVDMPRPGFPPTVESEDELSDIDIETINGDEQPPVKILAAKRDVLAEDFLQVQVREISEKNAHMKNKLQVINPSDDENYVSDSDSENDEGNALVYYTTNDALNEPSLEMEVTEEPVCIKEELDEELDPEPVPQSIGETWTKNDQHNGAQSTGSETGSDNSAEGNDKQKQMMMMKPSIRNDAKKMKNLGNDSANQLLKECTMCGTMFPADALRLHHHTKAHYKVRGLNKKIEQTTWTECGYCHVIFGHHVDELSHFAKFHQELAPLVSKATEFHSCSICPLSFGNVSCWLNHVKNHLVSDVVHKCHVCKKTFTSQAKFLFHVYSHRTGETYNCRQCDAQFALELTLMNHYLRKHPAVTVHPCSKCGERFLSKEKLAQHVDDRHPINVFGTVTAYDDSAHATPVLPLELRSATSSANNEPEQYNSGDRGKVLTPEQSTQTLNKLNSLIGKKSPAKHVGMPYSKSQTVRAIKPALLPECLRPISPPMISTKEMRERPPDLLSKLDRISSQVVPLTTDGRSQTVNCLISVTGETVKFLGTVPHTCASAITPHRRTANASAFYEKVHGASAKPGDSEESLNRTECRTKEKMSRSAKKSSYGREHPGENLNKTIVRMKTEPPDYDEESAETDNNFTEAAQEEKPFVIKEEIVDELPTVFDGFNAIERFSQESICCVFCEEMFDSSDGIKVHISSGACRIRKPALTAPKYKHGLTCEVCEARLQNKASLSIHVLLHSPFTECRLCHKRFATRRKLASHYTTHFDLGYKCTYCPRTFLTSGEQTQHSDLHLQERNVDKNDKKRPLEVTDHGPGTDQTFRISPPPSSSKIAKLCESDVESIIGGDDGEGIDSDNMDFSDEWDGSTKRKNDPVDQCPTDSKSNHSQQFEKARHPKTLVGTHFPEYEVFWNEENESENSDTNL